MNRSELPELYRDLVDLRRMQAINPAYPDPEEEEIHRGFFWDQTPEDHDFWQSCFYGRTVANLPPIPESSIQELIELLIIETPQSPMNTDTIRDDNRQALHPEFQTLAQHNRAELGPCGGEGDDPNELMFAFTWIRTEQGRNFWARVNRNESTDADLALAIEANRNNTTTHPIKKKTVKPLFTHPTPEPKKNSTMEDVFAGMNRHAKKEDSKETITEKDNALLKELQRDEHVAETNAAAWRKHQDLDD